MKTLASLTAVLVMASAGAASAEARVPWGDLNLASISGGDTFDVRVARVADRMCRSARAPGRLISDRSFCRAAVHREAVGQLPRTAQIDYAMSRRAVAY